MFKKSRGLSIGILGGVTLISTSLFMYEIAISRVFAALLPYHFVFMILSTAILGMGIGSTIEFKRIKKAGRINPLEEHAKLVSYMAYSMFGSFVVIYFVPFIKFNLLYIGVAAVPYIFAGQFFTSLFTNYGEYSNKIYFADLIGAGAASALSIGIFYFIGFIPAVKLIFVIVFISALVFSIRAAEKKHIYINSLLALFMLFLSVIPNTGKFIEKNFISFLTSPYTILARFKNSGTEAKIIYTNWDGFARTDVIKLKGDDSARIVSTNGAANTQMIKYDGINDFYGLRKQIDYIPYLINENAEVAIVGAGGGRDVLQAVLGGAKSIDAIDINRSTVQAVKDMGRYNGDIYENSKVNVIVGDGRSVLEKSNKKYDIIFLSMVMTGAAQANGYALAENYIYTKEAVQTYYDHLKPNGKLVFVGHNNMDMAKLTNTSLKVLQENGIPNKLLKDQIFLGGELHEGEKTMVHSPVVMMAKKPYSQEEIELINIFFTEQHYSVLHLSGGVQEDYITSISEGKATLEGLMKESKFDIKPSSDERPFFYNFHKGIPITFIFVLLSVYSCISIFFRKPLAEQNIKKRGHYFSLLGVGFMVVEVAFIQKMAIYLEHPTTAFVVTISALLIGAGVGSFFSHGAWLVEKDGKHRGAVLAFISILVTGLVFKFASDRIFFIPLWEKVLAAGLIIFVNGFFMGMIFPYSISLSKKIDDEKNIPIFYGINGLFSMVGSVIAVIISMKLGVTATLFAGSIIYGVIYMFMPVLSQESSRLSLQKNRIKSSKSAYLKNRRS